LKQYEQQRTWLRLHTDKPQFPPRYVTEMMARLCKVDMNSYVWDYAAGSSPSSTITPKSIFCKKGPDLPEINTAKFC